MIVLVCALVALSVAFFADRRLRARIAYVEAEAAAVNELAAYAGESLAVELALRLADERQEGGAARRTVARARRLATQVELPDDTRGALELGCALPAVAVEDRRLALPGATREILRWRRVVEEGGRAEPGGTLPLHVQVAIASAWFESQRNTSAESLRDTLLTGAVVGLSPQVIQANLALLDALVNPEEDDAMAGLPGVGIVLCVRPDVVPGAESAFLTATLRATEARVRARLRPGDRVYVADHDVIAWLPTAREKDAAAVVTRLAPTLSHVPVSNQRLRCRLGAAVAGVDAQRMPDLVMIARSRTAEVQATRVA